MTVPFNEAKAVSDDTDALLIIPDFTAGNGREEDYISLQSNISVDPAVRVGPE